MLPDSYVDPENKDYGGKKQGKKNSLLFLSLSRILMRHLVGISGAVRERGDRAEVAGEAATGGASAAESPGQAPLQRPHPLRSPQGKSAALKISLLSLSISTLYLWDVHVLHEK